MNPIVEGSVLAAAVVEAEQRVDVGFGGRAAVRQPRHARKDGRGAGTFLRTDFWLADEDRAPAGRVLRRALCFIRPADLYRANVGVAHIDLIVRDDAAQLHRLGKALRLPHFSYKGDADNMGPRLHGDANFEARIARYLHIGFPFGIAGEAGLAVAGVAGRRGPALRAASHGETLEELAIQPDIELLRPAHALEVILILALEANFDQVLAVHRKIVVNRHAAAGANRQVFAHAVFLQHMERNLEAVHTGFSGRKPYCQTRDLPGHRHVPLKMRSGDG